jgi:NitT/TauT family transport system substrate-binding protein
VALRTGTAAWTLAICLGFSVQALAADAPVTISTVQSVPSATNYIALDKGYFRDAGVEVQIETIDSLSKAMAILATNQIQIAQGGINAGYFNAVGQGLPIILALESGSTPVYHNFMVRPDLKDKIRVPADLKGRTVAVSGAGSLSTYELASVLASAGLTLADVNVKQLGFPQMLPSLANGALDVALMVAPYTDAARAQGVAVPWLDPEQGFVKALPMTSLAYMASADWIRDHRDQARRVFVALARATRDYCQAYHHGPNRGEVLDIMMKHGIARDRAQLDAMDWQARDPNGRANPQSLADMLRQFKAEGMIERDPPLARLVDTSFAEDVARTLGPFELINKASPLQGCR